MKAVRYHEHGEPSVLRVEEVEQPAPGPTDILVEVRAASVNPTDAKRRASGNTMLPKTTGSDFAGVVKTVGEQVSEYVPGDCVCGTGLHTTRFQQGSFAEYVAVPTDVVASLPDELSFKEGAAIALVGVTAWWTLVDIADLEPTEACLIHGGTGGVGHVATQLACLSKATVVVTAGSEKSHRAAAEFGADAVVDYRRTDLLEAVMAYADRGFDVILDSRVYEYFTFDLEAAAFDARIIHYGGVRGTVHNSPAGLQKNVTIDLITMSNLVTHDEYPDVSAILEKVLELARRDVLNVAIARTYSLDEAVEAHRAVLEDSFVGKLVVLPS